MQAFPPFASRSYRLAMCALVLCGAACEEPSSPAAAPPPPPVSPQPAARVEPVRPPFPNMATASWGAHVIEARAEGADPGLSGRGYKAALEAALQELHGATAGSEARAAMAATAAYRAAQADAERATAAALLGAALTLEPGAEGFKERLTDAHGLAAYAGTLEPATVLSQAARAFVAVAAGRVQEGGKLTEALSKGPAPDPDARLFLGLSYRYQASRSDEALMHFQAVLQDKPESNRARVALAEGLLELGLVAAAAEVASAEGATPAPYLDAVRGRALALEGRAEEGIALLQRAEQALDEARRGQALYWLGRSWIDAGRLQEATQALGTLSGRPGFESEAALLEGLLAKLQGDYPRARARADTVCRARGVPLSLALECQWAVVEACAGLGDAACVERWGRRAKGADDDHARLALAKAALAKAALAKAALAKAALGRVGDPADIDVDAVQKEAHLLSPFDLSLAARAGLGAVGGGAKAAAAVRGARRALVFQAPRAAERELLPHVERLRGCRVCRAVYARAAVEVDEVARRAVKALEGKGPPLAEVDLLPLIDALGASPVARGTAWLGRLAEDPRPAVKEAVAQARKDLKDPEGRKRRLEEKARGHDEHGEARGSAPAPAWTPPGGSPIQGFIPPASAPRSAPTQGAP